MELSLKNIGKISETSIEINGITVIAGENNTGKSTVGKALYCLFNTFHNINDKIADERSISIYRTMSISLKRGFINVKPVKLRKLSKEICDNREKYIKDIDALRGVFEEFCEFPVAHIECAEEYSIEEILHKVLSYLRLDDNAIKVNVLKRILSAEYGMQIGYVNSEETTSSISLKIHGKKGIDVEIENSEKITIKNSIDIYSNLAYIEDPFVIDDLGSDSRLVFIRTEDHRSKLVNMLVQVRDGSVVGNVIEEMVMSEKLTHIFEILSKICEGSLIETEDSYAYTSSKFKKPLALSNISTGLKTFLILKTLLMNGAIEEGGIIVLDEPEIHLHPEWQLLFAELIVLLQKEFGLHVLLNTHSPYFLRAIQVYSAKYEIADTCKYYLSEAEGERAYITDVTECIEQIYVKLSRPLQSLEDTRWQDDQPE